jgi:peptidoglycan-associated lipoprotein
MNKLRFAPLLIALTVALTACADSKKGDHFTDLGEDGSMPGSGDKVDTTGIPIGTRGNFNPETDVNYDTLQADTIYFAFDSSTVPSSERMKLQQVSEWMKANPDHSLYLAGHADKRGTPEYNRALGERRALAVREYLVGLGVAPGALYTNSYGADRPAVEGDSEAAYAKNRRVQVGVVIKP